MRDFWEEVESENTKKKINKKKIITISAIVVILILVITTTLIYIYNQPAREWIDKNILRKEVLQNNATTIELKDGQSSIYAFNKYIGILSKTKLNIYNQSGNSEAELDIQISNPLFNSANRFLAIAENQGQKFYLIEDKEIKWEAEVEGNIAQINVNKNGYVAVAITGTSYKTVVAMYSPDGKELFKTYLSSSRAVDITISNDNKYLAIAEIDTSGTIIKSSVKVISIEKASTDPTNSVENTFEGENDKLITNIQYQDKDRLLCMYTDEITIIENGEETILLDNNNKKVIFQSVELTNNAASVEEKSSGLFTANSEVSIVSTDNKETKTYTAESVAKEIITYGNKIALNLGTEVEFISTDGWLVKRYIANQEITNIVMSDTIAGIVYRDKIEIINL